MQQYFIIYHKIINIAEYQLQRLPWQPRHFRQYSAPAHRACVSASGLATTPDLVSPDLWPLNSPDLNPVDYKIWDCLQERVYQERGRDIDDLKREHLVEVCPQSHHTSSSQPDAVSHHGRRVCASDTPAQMGLGRYC